MKISTLLRTAAALSCAALTVSCSRESAPADAVAAPAGASVIGISIPAADHGWTGGLVFWANKAKQDLEAANPGLRVLLSSAKDPADQVSGIENLLVQDVQALVVLPHEPAPLTPICKQVAARGVKLIVVDRGLTENVMDYSVVGDNPGFGRVSGEQIAKVLGGKGKVVFMEGVLCQVNTDRVTAFKKAAQSLSGFAPRGREDSPRRRRLQSGRQDDSRWQSARHANRHLSAADDLRGGSACCGHAQRQGTARRRQG